MAALLALAAAAVYGAGDFLGGLATRRVPPAAVVLLSQLAGGAVLVPAVLLLPEADPTAADLRAGAVSGAIGALGVSLLYLALARGVMSTVAPITALTAAALPVVVGVLGGDRPSVGAAAGIATAFVAIVLITREPAGGAGAGGGTARRYVAVALLAGCCFGAVFILLGRTSTDAGLWPLVAARTVSFVVLVVAVIVRRVPLRPPSGTGATIAAAGVLDMGANVLFLLAAKRGLLSVVAVLTALYPASTVVLAQTVLGERLRRPQVVGLAGSVVAAILIAAA